ncbi:MAG: rod shape-determining protein MreD [Acidisphaera sp.]|nr:rod shape-determining protein MreD [Acidisphaera sp.]MBV9812224.1 rod shape-determining protein MreD [Acetobacteraceae bacterium]
MPGIRPRPSLKRWLDMASRRSFPAATTAVVLLVLAAPLGLPGQPEMQGALALCGVFFWSLFRPDSMPPPVVFLLGLLDDLLGYAPIGVAVVIFLIIHGIAMRWRRVVTRQGFLIVWLMFVAVASGAAGLQWALSCVLTWTLLPPGPGLFLAALAAGIYPAVATLLTRAHATLAEPEQA